MVSIVDIRTVTQMSQCVVQNTVTQRHNSTLCK